MKKDTNINFYAILMSKVEKSLLKVSYVISKGLFGVIVLIKKLTKIIKSSAQLSL